jgi:hypothetical protein
MEPTVELSLLGEQKTEFTNYAEQKSTTTTLPSFYGSEFTRPTTIPLDLFTASVQAMKKGIKRNPFPHWNKDTGENPHKCSHEVSKGYMLHTCADCKTENAIVGDQLMREEMSESKIREEDAANIHHTSMLHACGVPVAWLLAFTFDHDCWDKSTWWVNRHIIKEATRFTRSRYMHIPKMKEYATPAHIFMSHPWKAKWGDVVMASCHGARWDRVVWIDLFAVRQWPGKDADLDFRPIVRLCKALIVSVSPVDGLQTIKEDLRLRRQKQQQKLGLYGYFLVTCIVGIAFFGLGTFGSAANYSKDYRTNITANLTSPTTSNLTTTVPRTNHTTRPIIVILFLPFTLVLLLLFLYELFGFGDRNRERTRILNQRTFWASDEGTRVKKVVPFYRLWCIVEIAAAIAQKVEVVIKNGRATKIDELTFSYVFGSGNMLQNLEGIIDVESSETLKPEDKVREIKKIRGEATLTLGVALQNLPVIGSVVTQEADGNQSVQGKITSYDASTCKLTVTDADGSFSENKTICIKSHEMSMNAMPIRLQDGVQEVNTTVSQVVLAARQLISSSTAENIKTGEGCFRATDGDDLFEYNTKVDTAVCGEGDILDSLFRRSEVTNDELFHESTRVLRVACMGGRTTVVRIILEKCLQLRGNSGLKELVSQSQVFAVAAEYGQIEVAKVLMHMIDIDKNFGNPLYKACEHGHLNMVEFLLEEALNDSSNVETKDPSYLSSSVNSNCSPTMHVPIDPNQLFGGRPPLSVARQKGHTQIVRCLLQHPAVDPNTFLLTFWSSGVFFLIILSFLWILPVALLISIFTNQDEYCEGSVCIIGYTIFLSGLIVSGIGFLYTVRYEMRGCLLKD